MWRVADHASFSLHWSVFEDEGTRFVCVAAEANLVLGGGRAKLARQESTMRIMAIAASHKAFVHAMVNGFGELRLNFKMAAVAEHWLCHGQKSSFYFGMVRRMTVNAAYVVLQVLGAQKVCVLFSEFMAAQAAFAGLFAREGFETDDLSNVAASFGVRFAWAVACFTSLILHATVIEHRLPVRAVVVCLGDIVVAASAGIVTGVKGRIGRISDEFLVLCLVGIGRLTPSRILVRARSRTTCREQGE